MNHTSKILFMLIMVFAILLSFMTITASAETDGEESGASDIVSKGKSFISDLFDKLSIPSPDGAEDGESAEGGLFSQLNEYHAQVVILVCVGIVALCIILSCIFVLIKPIHKPWWML